jgi:hypothetical protein
LRCGSLVAVGASPGAVGCLAEEVVRIALLLVGHRSRRLGRRLGGRSRRSRYGSRRRAGGSGELNQEGGHFLSQRWLLIQLDELTLVQLFALAICQTRKGTDVSRRPEISGRKEGEERERESKIL